MTASPLRVLVWNENIHETTGDEKAIANYPDGIHTAIADGLRSHLGADAEVTTATLQRAGARPHRRRSSTAPMCCCGGATSDTTRSMTRSSTACTRHPWRHGHRGAALRALFEDLQAADGHDRSLKWRNDGERELVWTVAPRHPIADGVPHPIHIPEQEMYGEFFDIPTPTSRLHLDSRAVRFSAAASPIRAGWARLLFLPRRPGISGLPPSRRAAGTANGVRWVAPGPRRPHRRYHAPGWYQA